MFRRLPTVPNKGPVVTDTATLCKRRIADRDDRISDLEEVNKANLRALEVANKRLRRY